jgi:aspartate/glutamate racemase
MSGNEGRVLGLIGGLGPGATVHYYNGLIARIRHKAASRRRLLS